MEQCSEQNEVLFPSEEEIKSYFPNDVWDAMAEYERTSYRNILHNYNVMKSLDLRPKKPSFMILYQKKASKRKAVSDLCRVPAKKPQFPKEKPLKKIPVKEQPKKKSVMFSSSHKWRCIQLHNVFTAVFKVYKRYFGSIKGHYFNKRKAPNISKKHLKVNMNKENVVETPKNYVVIKHGKDKNPPKSETNNHCNGENSLQPLGNSLVDKNVGEIIEKSNIVAAQDDNINKENYVKTPKHEVAIKDGKDKNLPKSETNNHCNGENSLQPLGNSLVDKNVGKIIEKTNIVAAQDDAPKRTEESKVSTDLKKEELAKRIKKLAATQKKPVCRSVQTMTVDVGCSPSDSALVFINAATSKKLSVAFPDPKPLTPLQKKVMKRINKEKMKTRRNIQTQTAAENSGIEEASLVFVPVLKPKNPKSTTKADPDKKKVLPNTENQQDQIPHSLDTPKPATKPDTSVTVACPPSGSDIDKKDPRPNVTDLIGKGKNDDTSSDDEFGFYALARKQQSDATAKKASSAKPNIAGSSQLGDTALAVPGCSGLQFDSKAKKASTAKPNIPGTSQHGDTDLAVPGCSGLQSDTKAKKKISIKTNIPETKVEPKDTDLAVPGHSSQLPDKRYPRRAVPVVNYTEAELLQDDEYLFCDLCDREYEGDCPEHGPHKFFPDRFIPVTGEDSRAIQTTPAMLKVDKSKIPGAGSGVWTMLGLPPHVRFGPYQGDETSEPDPLGYSWAIVKDRRVDHYIAAQSTATSNWMRFVNCARHETEQNLMAFQYKGQMYYRTVKLIPPKAELFVWYGKEYAELLGISRESFRSKDTSHLRNLVFSCDKCNVTYTSPLYLEAHGKHCRGKRTAIVDPFRVPADIQTLAVVVDGRKTYCCNLCNYKTANSGNIKHHMVTHSGKKPHVCDVCGRGFTRAGSVVKHKRIHTGDKPYKCDQCPYACNQSSALRSHMTRHTGEKVYSCPDCDYETAQSCHMERHSRKHSGAKPYCCTLCAYRTGDSSHLTKHMRTHTGEKPHACPHCPYRAAHKVSLNKHIASLHSTHK